MIELYGTKEDFMEYHNNILNLNEITKGRTICADGQLNGFIELRF